MENIYENGVFIIPIKLTQLVSKNAALLYSQIVFFSYKRGHCFATNEYLAKRLGYNKRTIPKLLSELKNYLKITITDNNKRQIIPLYFPDVYKGKNNDDGEGNDDQMSMKGDDQKVQRDAPNAMGGMPKRHGGDAQKAYPPEGKNAKNLLKIAKKEATACGEDNENKSRVSSYEETIVCDDYIPPPPPSPNLFNSDSYLRWVSSTGKQRKVQLCARYFLAKKMVFPNKAAVSDGIRRFSKVAKKLENFGDDEIVETMEWLDSQDWLAQNWTMETILKYVPMIKNLTPTSLDQEVQKLIRGANGDGEIAMHRFIDKYGIGKLKPYYNLFTGY